MKKLTPFTLIMLLSIGAYAQTPSKQATMDWIAGKFKDCFRQDLPSDNNDKGDFDYERATWFKSFDGHTITLDGIKYYTKTEYSLVYEEKKVLYYLDLSRVREITVVYSNYRPLLRINGVGIVNRNDGIRFDHFFLERYFNWDCQENLRDRMKKAFETLIKFNVAESGKEDF